MRATVLVRPKQGILDPEGQAVESSLRQLGFSVGQARVGRVVDLEVESADPSAARAEIERMCEQLLANPLIESYETELADLDAVVLPGGFSYGDYLRCGAIARFAPAMNAIAEFAGEGGLVLGICNGFQILCEAGLLPGVLRRNESLSFVCRDVPLVVERTD